MKLSGVLFFLLSLLPASKSSAVPDIQFSPAGTQPLEYNIPQTATGDFNGDGKLDVIAASFNTQTAGIWLGNGDGTFQSGPRFYVGAATELVAVEITGDQKTDLAVAAYPYPGQVNLLLGRGDGSFDAPMTVPSSTGTQSLIAGRLNMDSRDDLLAVTAINGSVKAVVLLGKADGSFEVAASYAFQSVGQLHSTIGDFNGDGFSDFIVAGMSPNGLHVFIGNGDDTFQPRSLITTSLPDSLSACNLNSDGKDDLVGTFLDASNNSHAITFLNNGDGTFTQTKSVEGGLPFVADFTGDSKNDLALLRGQTLELYAGNGDGTFQQPTFAQIAKSGSNGIASAMADFNGDQKPDVLFTTAPSPFGSNSFTTLGFQVSLHQADGTYQEAPRYPMVTHLQSAVGGDLDHDNASDYILSAPDSRALVLSLHRIGGFQFYDAGIFPTALALGKVSSDDDLDVVAVNADTGQLSVVLALNDDPTHLPLRFQPPVLYSAGTKPVAVAIGDFDKDGAGDPVVADETGKQLLIFPGTASGALQTPTHIPLNSEPSALAIEDFNHDSKLDIAVASAKSNTISLLFGNGDGTFQSPADLSVEGGPSVLVAGDLNGDGAPDLVSGNVTGDSIGILLNKGDGAFHPAAYIPTGAHPVAVTLSDFDGDHHLDIAGVNSEKNTVTVYAGLGDGSFGLAKTFDVQNSPSALVAGNFWGDDVAPDLEVANHDSGTISNLTNQPPPPALLITRIGGVAVPPPPKGYEVYATVVLPPTTDLQSVPLEVANTNLSDGTVVHLLKNAAEVGTATITGGIALFHVSLPANAPSGNLTLTQFQATATSTFPVNKSVSSNSFKAMVERVPETALWVSRVQGILTPPVPSGSTTDPDVVFPANADLSAVSVVVSAVNFSDGAQVQLLQNDQVVATSALEGGKAKFSVSLPPVPAEGTIPTTILKAVIQTPGNFHSSSLSIGVKRSPADALASGIIQTVAGNGEAKYAGDQGEAVSASLANAGGMDRDAKGNLYIADTANNRIRKISPEGVITTVAGSGTLNSSGYSVYDGDDKPAIEATLTGPEDVAVDGVGNLYIADTGNGRIRKVDTKGIITTVAGGSSVSNGGPFAVGNPLVHPLGVAVDEKGNLYIADAGSNAVLKVRPDGRETLMAGSGGSGLGPYVSIHYYPLPEYTGDGTAPYLTLKTPTDVALDDSGNLFVADTYRHQILKIRPDGQSSVVVGGVDATGASASAVQTLLDQPSRLTVDGAGSLYVVTRGDHRIRKVSSGGMATVVAGNGEGGFSGDGGPSTAARLNTPEGIVLDPAGNLYVADRGNQRIREVVRADLVSTPAPALPEPADFSSSLDTSITGPLALASGDFDGDHKTDLAVVSSERVGIYWGKGDGTLGDFYTWQSNGGMPTFLAAANLDGDGLDDLVIGWPSTYAWVHGRSDRQIMGLGTPFLSEISHSGIPFDFNSDGKTDLAMNGFGMSVWLTANGSPDQQVALPNYSIGTGPLAAGDFNNDGNSDLALAMANVNRSISYPPGDSKVEIAFGNGKDQISLGQQFTIGSNPYTVATGDFNGDGNLDLATSNQGSNDVSILLGQGDGSFSPVVNYPAGVATRSLAVEDFNGDGSLDIAVSDLDKSAVTVLFGDGKGRFLRRASYPVPAPIVTTDNGTLSNPPIVFPLPLVTGDFNGDGKPDLATANTNNTISILLNQTIVPSVVPGDVDGDGQVKIKDVETLLQIYLGLQSATPANLLAGDVRPKPGFNGRAYGNRRILADDVNWVLRAALGMEITP